MTKSKVLRRGFASKFYAYRTINQIIPTGVWTLINLDGELFDMLAEFDSAILYRFVASENGYYNFVANARFGALPVGTVSQLRMSLTGVPVSMMSTINNGAFDFRMQTVWFGYVLNTDRIEMEIRQNSGVNQNLLGSWWGTHLSGYKVS